MTVAVVTSSIGRDSLKDTIESVKNQSYPCKHYVFVNGKEFHDDAKKTLNLYPEVNTIYLPVNTGNDGYGMAGVFAASPFLVTEDIVFYLDDDNTWETNHVETLVALIKSYNLGWAYSLRKIFDKDTGTIIEDNCSSLGQWNPLGDPETLRLVDNSCYAIKRDLAIKTSFAWYHPMISDRMFLQNLFKSKSPFGCTGKYTAIYTRSKWSTMEFYKTENAKLYERYNGIYPWANKINIFKFE